MNASDPGARRDAMARLRFSIIGPLMASPPAQGQLYQTLQSLAAKTWRHPLSGLSVQFSVSTIERWYYAARGAQDPVSALKDRWRADINRFPSLSTRVTEALAQQYRQHPGWTMQLHVDNLRAAFKDTGTTIPSYPTIVRYLKAKGMVRKRRPSTTGALLAQQRIEQLEVRSYEVEHVNALWHLDFHHGSRKVLTRNGQWVKPLLLCVIDDRSRLVCHLQWYLNETAQSLVHGVCQAFMKRGLPRAIMSDNGAAMLAQETTTGFSQLGIVHETTLPYSPYQNAKQEAFWGRIEGRLMPLLEGQSDPTLQTLNLATQAWVEQEYHRSVHSELKETPMARYIAGPSVARDCPNAETLQASFRIEVARRQRRSDGTITLEGQRFEIPSRYRHLQQVHVRYARWDLSRVDLIDARHGQTLCPIKPLDKAANASGLRRRLPMPETSLTPEPASEMPALMQQLLADYAATGQPPAYLPSNDEVL